MLRMCIEIVGNGNRQLATGNGQQSKQTPTHRHMTAENAGNLSQHSEYVPKIFNLFSLKRFSFYSVLFCAVLPDGSAFKKMYPLLLLVLPSMMVLQPGQKIEKHIQHIAQKINENKIEMRQQLRQQVPAKLIATCALLISCLWGAGGGNVGD